MRSAAWFLLASNVRHAKRQRGRAVLVRSLHALELEQKNNKAMVRVTQVLKLFMAAHGTGLYLRTEARRVTLALYNQLLENYKR